LGFLGVWGSGFRFWRSGLWVCEVFGRWVVARGRRETKHGGALAGPHARLRRRVRQAAEDGVDLGVVDVVDLDQGGDVGGGQQVGEDVRKLLRGAGGRGRAGESRRRERREEEEGRGSGVCVRAQEVGRTRAIAAVGGGGRRSGAGWGRNGGRGGMGAEWGAAPDGGAVGCAAAAGGRAFPPPWLRRRPRAPCRPACRPSAR